MAEVKTHRRVCPDCDGTGREGAVADRTLPACPVCHGDGQVEAIARDDSERLRQFISAFDRWRVCSIDGEAERIALRGLVAARDALDGKKGGGA